MKLIKTIVTLLINMTMKLIKTIVTLLINLRITYKTDQLITDQLIMQNYIKFSSYIYGIPYLEPILITVLIKNKCFFIW